MDFLPRSDRVAAVRAQALERACFYAAGRGLRWLNLAESKSTASKFRAGGPLYMPEEEG